MSVEIRLFGFGEDRPARFGGSNRLRIDVDAPASVRALLRAAGIEAAPDLVVMDCDRVIAPNGWDESRIEDGATLTVMSAIEGG
jgi:sulfur carrier protein ThiS